MEERRIIQVLDAIGAEYKKVGQRFFVNCKLAPYEGHATKTDENASLVVHIQEGKPCGVHCFGCKFSGTLYKYVKKLSEYEDINKNILELAKENVTQQSIVGMDLEIEKKEFAVDVIIPEKKIKRYTEKLPIYVKKRGFTDEDMIEWEIGFDEGRQRVVFPVRNRAMQLVGAIGRAITRRMAAQRKYYNYWRFAKSRYLYGAHKSNGFKWVVVEGCFDCMRVWKQLKQHDLLNEYSVVAIMGSDISEEQAEKLITWGNEVILFQDNDDAGKIDWDSLAEKPAYKMTKFEYIMEGLRRRTILREVKYPEGVGDPDEWGKCSNFVHAIKGAELVGMDLPKFGVR